MTKNDNNMTGQLWNYKIENRLFNICVGKTVGGKSPEISRLFFKVSLTNDEHFNAHDMGTDSYSDMRTVVLSQSVGVKFLNFFSQK